MTHPKAEARAASAEISKDIDIPRSDVSKLEELFRIDESIPATYSSHNFFSDLVRGLLEVERVQHGEVSCLLTVKPVATNFYGGLHGGAVAAVSELVSIACARTVVAKEKELFLGEMGISYLSAAPKNAQLTVKGSVIRTGRNLTMVAVEFKHQITGNLMYIARTTLYNLPAASL